MIVRGWWNIDGMPLPEEWSALWAALTFLVTLVAATGALLQLSAYLSDRAAQARPYLVVDFKFRTLLLQVEVQNVSATLATNLRLTVDTPFRSTRHDREGVLARIVSPEYVIHQLAPGRAIGWFLDRTPDHLARKDFPRVYRVTATYEDSRGPRRHWLRPWEEAVTPTYSDVFELSLDQWSEALADSDYDNKNWNAFNRMDGSLSKIATRVAEIAQDVGAFVEQEVERPDEERPDEG